ncbi:hypothetical protein C8Q74DRAFT_130852 [Fomes fomentarius]|nr:hypothetical protein C8Q74DRAFT_130852 [Fomes fomentarius]
MRAKERNDDEDPSSLVEALVETSETPGLAAATGNDATQAHHVEPMKEDDIPADSDHDEKTPPAASPYEIHTPEGYISPVSLTAQLPLQWCGEAEVSSAGEVPDSVYAFEHDVASLGDPARALIISPHNPEEARVSAPLDNYYILAVSLRSALAQLDLDALCRCGDDDEVGRPTTLAELGRWIEEQNAFSTALLDAIAAGAYAHLGLEPESVER